MIQKHVKGWLYKKRYQQVQEINNSNKSFNEMVKNVQSIFDANLKFSRYLCILSIIHLILIFFSDCKVDTDHPEMGSRLRQSTSCSPSSSNESRNHFADKHQRMGQEDSIQVKIKFHVWISTSLIETILIKSIGKKLKSLANNQFNWLR